MLVQHSGTTGIYCRTFHVPSNFLFYTVVTLLVYEYDKNNCHPILYGIRHTDHVARTSGKTLSCFVKNKFELRKTVLSWLPSGPRFLLGLFNGMMTASKTLVTEVCGTEHATVGMGLITCEIVATKYCLVYHATKYEVSGAPELRRCFPTEILTDDSGRKLKLRCKPIDASSPRYLGRP